MGVLARLVIGLALGAIALTVVQQAWMSMMMRRIEEVRKGPVEPLPGPGMTEDTERMMRAMKPPPWIAARAAKQQAGAAP